MKSSSPSAYQAAAQHQQSHSATRPTQLSITLGSGSKGDNGGGGSGMFSLFGVGSGSQQKTP